MPVNESGHQKASIEVNGRRLRGDIGCNALIAADVDNPPVANRECLRVRIAGMGGEYDAIAVDAGSAGSAADAADAVDTADAAERVVNDGDADAATMGSAVAMSPAMARRRR